MSQVINFLSSSESLKYIFALDAPQENCYVFKNAVEKKINGFFIYYCSITLTKNILSEIKGSV